jgi:predicted dehydrogenase/kynurenine formamidase
MNQLRGLCIGAGYFSQFHIDAWKRIPEAQIVAVCDLDPAKARQAATNLGGAEACTDVAAALDRHRPDFVDIITPPGTHLPLIELVAAHPHVAIICQKPLAPDFGTARRIVETAQRRGVRLMVHENFRFQPWHREIKRLIETGVPGEKLHSLTFRSRPGDGWGDDAYLSRQPYFRVMPRLLVHETGVHFIDTFRYLAGEIAETYAVLRKLNPVIAGEDAGLLTFRFANGAVGQWDANRYNQSNSSDPRYTFGEFLVEGSGGSVRLYADGRLTIQPLGEPERDHDYEYRPGIFGGDCVYFTQRHFIDRLLDGQPFETDGADYLRTLAVQEAVYRSAAENRPIAVPTDPLRVASPASRRRIVDLSLPLDNGVRGVQITPFTTRPAQGWTTTTLSLYSHCGTHMDAPRHFLDEPDVTTIDRLPLEVCCGPAHVVDLTPIEPQALITVEHLSERLPSIAPGDRLLLRTDWHHRLGTPEYRDGLPRISVELARWLVEQRVALIGVEPPSVADVNNLPEVTEVHQTLLRGGVVIVEGLAHLDQLRQPVVEFIALPLRVVGGDGSPVRAIAVETVP